MDRTKLLDLAQISIAFRFNYFELDYQIRM